MRNYIANNTLTNDGLAKYNRALFDNMAYFIDAVWIIDLKTQLVQSLHDKIDPEMSGKQWTLEDTKNIVKLNNHPDDVEELLGRFDIAYLMGLKDSIVYQAKPTIINGKSKTLKHVMTPEFDDYDNVLKVYVTFIDVDNN